MQKVETTNNSLELEAKIISIDVKGMMLLKFNRDIYLPIGYKGIGKK